MSKLYGAIIIALIVSIAGVNSAIAKKVKEVSCEVKSVEGNIATLNCTKNAKKIGEWKKVKVQKARKALEGC